MSQLDYLSPTTAEDAVRALSAGGGAAKVLGGGTDLLVQLRAGRIKPGLIIDLKRMPGAIGIRQEAGGFVIGAATSGAQIGENAALVRAWPGVVEAANLIGSTQVQGRASLAGNLCNASPAADSVPAMIAARPPASSSARRPARDPGREVADGARPHRLAADEFVLEIRLPARAPRSADAYLRQIPRTEMDIAVVGAAVSYGRGSILHAPGRFNEQAAGLVEVKVHVRPAGVRNLNPHGGGGHRL